MKRCFLMQFQKLPVSLAVCSGVALVSYFGGGNLAFAQAPDEGADSLVFSTNNQVIDLSTSDGGGGSNGNNSGGGSGDPGSNSGGNTNNNQNQNNNPPPCVPPPPGMFGGLANIIGSVLNPCG